MTEGSGIGCKISGLTKLRTVEQVVELGPKLQSSAFGEVHCLLQDRAPVVDAGTAEMIAAQVSSAAEWRIGEQSQVLLVTPPNASCAIPVAR